MEYKNVKKRMKKKEGKNNMNKLRKEMKRKNIINGEEKKRRKMKEGRNGKR